MATHKITRKVITPVKPIVKKVESVKVQVQPEEIETEIEESLSRSSVRVKKVCNFCQNKSKPTYTDLGVLRRFLTDRAKIVNKERSGVCSKHQRGVAKNIKYARHLALLPFVPKV